MADTAIALCRTIWLAFFVIFFSKAWERVLRLYNVFCLGAFCRNRQGVKPPTLCVRAHRSHHAQRCNWLALLIAPPLGGEVVGAAVHRHSGCVNVCRFRDTSVGTFPGAFLLAQGSSPIVTYETMNDSIAKQIAWRFPITA